MSRIYVSVFEEDDESAEIWANEIGVDPSKIIRMGAEDNFWAAGPTGGLPPIRIVFNFLLSIFKLTTCSNILYFFKKNFVFTTILIFFFLYTTTTTINVVIYYN